MVKAGGSITGRAVSCSALRRRRSIPGASSKKCARLNSALKNGIKCCRGGASIQRCRSSFRSEAECASCEKEAKPASQGKGKPIAALGAKATAESPYYRLSQQSVRHRVSETDV